MLDKEIVLFETEDKKITIPVNVSEETVWLTQQQMAELFQTSRTNVIDHIKNIYEEGELDEFSTCRNFRQVRKEGKRQVTRDLPFYNLDMIISLGYRVKSSTATQFRKWANDVLKRYVVQGYAVNNKRIQQLGSAIRIMKRSVDDLDAAQVLDVIERYNTALDLLDDYDHQNIRRPKGTVGAYVITYEECRQIINSMKFSGKSALFGLERDDSFKGTIGNIYQSFSGVDIYSTIEEKAANLLYLVTKNHSFIDGNKRIAAAMFLYFLEKNNLLFGDNKKKLIDDHTLVALTIMVAESRPDEKEIMISIIMNCIQKYDEELTGL